MLNSSIRKAWILSLLVALYSCAHASEVTRDTVRIPIGNDTILGVLFYPSSASAEHQVPGIVCFQGGGDVGLNNYLYEPRFFAEHGYVGLVCDKAGTGGSTGPSHWTRQSFEDKTEEYFAIVRYLKSLPFVDEKQVGIHGMSEGGRLVVRMAALASEEIAFAMSVSGPIESWRDNQLYAIENHLTGLGYEQMLIQRLLPIWEGYFDGIAAREIPQWVADSVRAIQDYNNPIYLPGATTELPDRPLPQDVNFSTIDDLESIQIPILFQYGAEDGRVNPHVSIQYLGHSEYFTIKLYENTGHDMTMDGNIHPDYDNDKLEWLRSTL